MANLEAPALIQLGAQGYVLNEIAQRIRPPSPEVERGRKDLYFLAHEILGYKDLNPQLHGDYCRWVSFQTNPAGKKMGLLPREHLKTTLGTVALCVQEIINDPDITILVANFTGGNAKKMLDEIKHHFSRNQRFRGIYGDYVGHKWNEDEIIVSKRIMANKTPTVDTAGVDKTLTSNHYRRIILDDLVTPENINTINQITTVIEYYREILDLLDKKDGKLVIHGTRYTAYELYGWILKHHRKDFDIIIRRAIEDGKVIYPERFSREKLQELRRQKGLANFAPQYFNYIYDSQNSLLKSGEENYYTTDDLESYLKDYPLFITMTIDAALDSTGKGCQTAMTVVGTTVNDEWILLDMTAGHWGTEIIGRAVDLIRKWRPRKLGMQKTMFEKLYKKELEDRLSTEHEYSPEFVMLKTAADMPKKIQIMSLRPRIERRGLFWRAEHIRFEMGARMFPNASEEVDILDSLSRHTEVAEKPYYEPPNEKMRRRFTRELVNPDDPRLPWVIER